MLTTVANALKFAVKVNCSGTAGYFGIGGFGFHRGKAQRERGTRRCPAAGALTGRFRVVAHGAGCAYSIPFPGGN
jgi:hypothetical protein